MEKEKKNVSKKNTKKESVNKKVEKKDETKKSTNKSSKKIIIIISSIIIAIALITTVVVIAINSSKNDDNTSSNDNKERVKITKSETSLVEYEKYDNGLISLDIPKGWTVEVAPLDYIHYSFKLYNPNNKKIMLLFGMKLEGYNKSEAAKNWEKKYYPSNMFAKTPVINPQTTEAFYKVWNETANYLNTYDVKYEYLPLMNEFTIIENLGSNVIGGDILRATYKDDNSNLIQGLFTATVKDVGSYYVNSNVMNFNSSKIDVFPLNVYNIILMTAPDEEFNNWQGILDKSLSSLEFSETFVNGFNKEEASILATIQANQKVYDQISDMIMDSWEKRNNSYDIISQKQSDATLGYERVYDTDTGEIYKAYNGFTDGYSGSKYKSITDDMYTAPISGYIER